MSKDRISADVDTEAQPLPYKRNPAGECLLCWAPAGEPCDQFCLALLPADEQIAHREAVKTAHREAVKFAHRNAEDHQDQLIAGLYCSLGAGRPRANPPRRRWRWLVAIMALVAVLTVGALWAAQRAKAETFDVCPSGVSGVASFDTSCAFADSVRAAFYWQPSWTIFAKSPVTGKIYTMQCSRTDTSGTGWLDSKRCFGVNDAGAVLIVFIA